MANKIFPDQHDDEKVELVFRQHPVVLRKGLYGLLGAMFLGLIPSAIWPDKTEYLWFILGGFGLGLLVFFYFWIGWYFSIHIITDQRFIKISQSGLFRRSVVDLGLDKIQNINYQVSGLQQTILGFGTIVIQTFVGDLVLDKIHKPKDIQSQMIKTIKDNGIEYTPEDEATNE